MAFIKKHIGWIVLGVVIVFLVGGLWQRISRGQVSQKLYLNQGERSTGSEPSYREDVSLGLQEFSGSVAMMKAAAPAAGAPVQADKTSRLVIKTGSFSVLVQDIAQTIDRLTLFVEREGGFVVSKYVSAQDQRPMGTLAVRVPVGKLDGLVAEARQASVRIISEQITGEDVTEEYVDVQARLENLRAAEIRFREILGRAQRIDEILNVQREIDRVRLSIDRETARKQYLERSAALSNVTFHLALDEEELPLVTPGEKWRPKVVYHNAVRELLGVVRGLGSLAIWLVVMAPVWLVLLIIGFTVRHFYRRRQSQP